MQYRRKLFIDSLTKMLNVSEGSAIPAAIEQKVFIDTFTYCRRKGIPANWTDIRFIRKYCNDVSIILKNTPTSTKS